jgi:glycosyltransferase involved in cell wall biosynthesis
MRIAVVCADLGIRVPGPKGASLHLQAISSAFAGLGHEVLLVAVAGHGDAPLGHQSLLLPHPGRTHGLRRELRKLRFMAALPGRIQPTLEGFAPEVVYERLSLFGARGRAIADRFDAVHVVEVNALLAREDAQWRGLRLASLARRREHAALSHADLRVAVSDEVARAVADVAPGPRVLVVPNGVDASTFAALPDRDGARAQLGLSPEVVWLGFSGALRPWHGLDRAVDALAHLPRHIHLVIAGDGPVRASIIEQARAQGVSDRVRFLGQIPHSAMPTFLAAIDVALAPYPDAGDFAFSPLKVYEYLAAGVPTVASDIGQLHDLLTAMPGALRVVAGDAVALGNGILHVVNDLAAWRGAATMARDRVLADHSWERRAEQIIEAIVGRDTHALAA